MRVWIGDVDQHQEAVEFVGLLVIGKDTMAVVRARGMELRTLPIDRVHLTRPLPREATT